MRINKKATCGQCKLGFNYGVPAVAYVSGKLKAGNGGRAFRCYVCLDHLDVMEQDAENIKVRPFNH